MRPSRRHLTRVLPLVLAAAVAGALAATLPTAEAQAPKKGGVLRVAERADPVGFDTLGQKKAASTPSSRSPSPTAGCSGARRPARSCPTSRRNGRSRPRRPT